MKELKDYLHLYCNRFNPIKVFVDNEDVKYLWDIEVYEEDYINLTLADTKFRDVKGDSDNWNVYNENHDLSRIKLILRELESITDEEAQECLVEVFLVPPHNAYMDVESLKQYLCNNTAYELGIQDESEGESKPMMAFEVTPQTYFNLTQWLLARQFDLYGLIPQGLAIDSTTLNPQP